ncbi:MAG: general stress protein CsbD [Pseudomonadota bacterium]
MNWNQIEGNSRPKGKAMPKKSKSSDGHVDAVAGSRKQLAEKSRKIYGIGKEEADRQIHEFFIPSRTSREEHHR